MTMIDDFTEKKTGVRYRCDILNGSDAEILSRRMESYLNRVLEQGHVVQQIMFLGKDTATSGYKAIIVWIGTVDISNEYYGSTSTPSGGGSSSISSSSQSSKSKPLPTYGYPYFKSNLDNNKWKKGYGKIYKTNYGQVTKSKK